MKACVIIPARFSSSRFPGKPLEKLLGKPMILWVAEVSSKAVGDKNVYIATDDERIYDTVKSAGFGALMTSNNALTGTDRVAEASKALDYDIFINVQGDEPLIDYNDIRKCIDLKSKYPDYVINGFSKITSKENPSSINIPKVVTNEKNFMLYMSRQLIPGYKSKLNKPISIKKQVCIYAFTYKELNAFGNKSQKSNYENAEDIEILRFFDLSIPIKMVETSSQSMAIDVPEDVVKVESELIKLEGNLK